MAAKHLSTALQRPASPAGAFVHGGESPAGPVQKAHDLGQAEKMLQAGLRGQELSAKPKGLLEKQVLAWWVDGHTVVSWQWLADNLWMGYETGVSRAVSFVESSQANRVKEMKNQLGKTGRRL